VAANTRLRYTVGLNQTAVMAALQAELNGGRSTGLEPRRDGDHILVSFTNTVVHATKLPTNAA
jgi:hypothetical protein